MGCNLDKDAHKKDLIKKKYVNLSELQQYVNNVLFL